MAPSPISISLVIMMTFALTNILGSANGRPSGDKNETRDGVLPPHSEPPKPGNPSIMELFKNFNVTEQIPDSAFQRFLVHIGRVLIVALVVVLWLLIAIQLYVWTGKCFTFLWRCYVRRKEGNDGEGEGEEGKEGQPPPSSDVKVKDIGKEGDYQKNYVNRTHSMPILIFKK